MIDIENYVINRISNALNNARSDVRVSSVAVQEKASFPCVTVQQTGNATYTFSNDQSLQEHHAIVNYQLDVYTVSKTAKSDAKEIMNIVDAEMQNMKFTRTYCSQTPNIDRTVFRMTARYDAIVEEPTVDDDGNLTYQMYRRR